MRSTKYMGISPIPFAAIITRGLNINKGRDRRDYILLFQLIVQGSNFIILQ